MVQDRSWRLALGVPVPFSSETSALSCCCPLCSTLPMTLDLRPCAFWAAGQGGMQGSFRGWGQGEGRG